MVEWRQLKKNEKLFNGNAHCTTTGVDVVTFGVLI